MVTESIETEAAILKKIDEQLKGLSPEVKAEAFQILVQRHLGPSAAAYRRAEAGHSQHAVKRAKPKGKPQLSIIKDLDLKNPSLRDFYTEKSPRTFFERNAVFVYYLQRLKETQEITPDHIFTCYKEVKERVPGAFYQSILDTRVKKGWLDTTDMNDIKVTTVGENFVEHDLPETPEE
jgi:hypothetical protein